VVLNRDDYFSKMNELLSDSHTYQIIERNPIKKLSQDLRSLLTRWKKKDFIDNYIYRKLLITDGILPRTYGLPKIHKPGQLFRIIISSIGSPLHPLSNFVHNMIKKQYPDIIQFCQKHLVSKLSGNILESDFELASLDIVSLFTNIPSELVYVSIEKRWEIISANTPIPQDEFLCAIRFILNSTFFTFNHTTYKQIFGTPMGSPLSPIISDLIL